MTLVLLLFLSVKKQVAITSGMPMEFFLKVNFIQGRKHRHSRAMANEGLILLRKNFDDEVEIGSEQKLDVSDGQLTKQ